MNLPIIERQVDRHLAAYCDPDAARRLETLREIWHPEGRLVDPPLEARGHQGIADRALGHLASVDRPVLYLPAPVALAGPTKNDRDQNGLGYQWVVCGGSSLIACESWLAG